jgi:transcriptional regulator with XRE-family HTH domain
MLISPMKVKKVEVIEVEAPGLGAKIKEAREADPRSVAALCREAGISRNYWYQLEAEAIQGSLSKETLDKIEQVLGVSFGVSFEGDRNA